MAAVLWLALAARPAAAQTVTVAAASDLQAVFPQVADRYQRETGRAVKVTFGSSGQFFSQIQNGAPFDLFFSADAEYPARLAAAGLGDGTTVVEYAVGRIVLWAPNGSPIDLRAGLSVLRDARVRRIAIANPAHAPYGRAAVNALQHDGLYEAVRGKLVLGENVSQAAQFVDSGNADVGIIALSIARTPALLARGLSQPISEDLYIPIRQAAIILNGSRDKVAARAFLSFVGTPAMVALMQQFGFVPPLRSSR